MIKLATWLVALAASTGVYAQGVVTFANNVLPSPPDRLVPGVDGRPLVGTQYAAQLYYSTQSASSLAAHTAAPNRFRAAGSSLAGTWSTTTGANRTLNGGGVGVPVWMQVRVWDLNQFPTYEAAVAGGGPVGTSEIFMYTQRLSTPTPSVTDTYMDNFVWRVPEPSTFLLAIPGIALLAFLRRRGASRN
jgi:hypothetical protein